MADNRHKYGFRYYSNLSGSGRLPPPLEMRIASGYAPAVTGGGVGLYIGDPVSLIASNGTVALYKDTTASEDSLPYGVIVGFSAVKFGPENKARPSSYYPTGGVTYSAGLEETKCLVIPFTSDVVWEIDVDDATTATTKAAYEAFIGENADMAAHVIDSSDANKPKADPRLDISTHAADTTGTEFRIVGLSKTQENVDFSGANVKLLVVANEARWPWSSLTGVA